MRIINIAGTDKYVAGVGKSLKPGDTSRELPLSFLFEKSVMDKVVRSKSFAVKLTEADKAVLGEILAQDAMALPKVKAKVSAYVPPAERRQQAEQAILKAKKEAEAKLPTMAPTPKVKPECVNGQPSYSALGATIPDVKPGQAMSLEQLKQHNAAVSAKKKDALNAAASIFGGRV